MYPIKAFSFVIMLFIPTLLLSQENIVSIDKTQTCSVDQIPFDIVEKAPIYPECAEQDSSELKNCFSDAISRFITENFNFSSTENYGDETFKIFVRFFINKKGQVTDISVRATSTLLERKLIRVIEKLPEMTPGKQKGKNVNVVYTFPIIIDIE